ncbi:alpha/beta fold hydrolase [Streptomyces sp. NPDC044984]|uniref:alpha/beta fold hydrolase n=1 Tax=Streptomyces sp. NPDC044984 TaxID=3154335 RepID=UPI0033E0811C
MVDPAATAEAGVVGDGLPLGEDYAGPRDLPVETVVSADGTTIAYEKSGSGPPVVIIGGGLNDKAMFTPLAQSLSRRFTVFNYDRRGRGGSDHGDPEQYTIDREVEDLVAVLDAVGEPGHVFANCSGGMIAIHAAAAGVPMAKLGLYEPPYSSPPLNGDEVDRLKRLVAEDRREEAVTLFGKEIVKFMTDETLERFKQHPAWQAFESMAPSCVYDAIINDRYGSIPHTLLPKIAVETLVLSGSESAPWIQEACVTLSEEIPRARLLRIEGEGHLFNQQTGAPLLVEFFGG